MGIFFVNITSLEFESIFDITDPFELYPWQTLAPKGAEFDQKIIERKKSNNAFTLKNLFLTISFPRGKQIYISSKIVQNNHIMNCIHVDTFENFNYSYFMNLG